MHAVYEHPGLAVFIDGIQDTCLQIKVFWVRRQVGEQYTEWDCERINGCDGAMIPSSD